MSADAPERPPRDTEGPWIAVTASQIGAGHQAAGLPNQDAVAVRHIQHGIVIAAVADGHGHRRHFRSARGSQLAVSVACEAGQELAAWLDGLEEAEQVRSAALRRLAPEITGRWRDAVRDDLAAQPFTAREEAARSAGDDALVAYGSTLLLAVVGRRWLALAQIGDGDILGIQRDGRPLLPVPGDPTLDGQQTTSLCGTRAEHQFRAAALDISTTALLGVLLATDGYGNAQVADPWAGAVSADLAELISDRPPEWLAAQLPLWASRCASADGSADDTTVALLIAPSAPGGRHAVPAAGEPPAAAPAGDIGGLRRVAPTRPSRLAVKAVALALIAGVVAFAAVRLSSSPGPALTGCRPSAGRIGQPVTGGAITACDTLTGRSVRVSAGRFPAGKRLALLVSDSVFVLAGNQLWWRRVSGREARWRDLGEVPAGTQQGLCLSAPSGLYAPSVVVAGASGRATPGGAGAWWTEVSVSAQSPVAVGPEASVHGNPCAVGRSR